MRRYEVRTEFREVSGVDELNLAVHGGAQFRGIVSRYGPRYLVSERKRRVIR